jgi:hypothetical protein
VANAEPSPGTGDGGVDQNQERDGVDDGDDDREDTSDEKLGTEAVVIDEA